MFDLGKTLPKTCMAISHKCNAKSTIKWHIELSDTIPTHNFERIAFDYKQKGAEPFKFDESLYESRSRILMQVNI